MEIPIDDVRELKDRIAELKAVLGEAVDHHGSQLYAKYKTLDPVPGVSPRWYVDARRLLQLT